jgi:hypothetical protein
MAGEDRYRVEILVLSHLQHAAVPLDAEWLRDFSSSLDFLKAEDREDEEGEDTQIDDLGAELLIVNSEADEPGEAETAPGQDAGSELLPDEDQPEEPWADVIAVEGMSDVMSEAWRRLRLSAPFRPEQYLSWEQSADEPFPSLRIHDINVLLIDSPCVDLPETSTIEAEEKDEPFVFTDQGNILPGDAMEEDAEESEWPDPTLFYRIDGTVMLRRSRFLHLDFDLELREAVLEERQPAPASILSGESESGEPEPPLPTSFLIHKLKQSRQVKSQRMEYFDSPVLGVLAWITPFEAEDEAEMLEASGESD